MTNPVSVLRRSLDPSHIHRFRTLTSPISVMRHYIKNTLHPLGGVALTDTCKRLTNYTFGEDTRLES
jgi:hypothetical protein